MMMTTSENIIHKIKQEHIKPEPKWHFLAKNWVLWAFFAVALLVGAISFAVLLEMVANHDWDLYIYLHKTFFEYLLFSLPYVWIFCLAIVALIAYYNFVHIKGWYRHRVYLVVLASVGGSVVLGGALFHYGIGQKVDTALAQNLPYYNLLKVDKQQLWDHPDEGLLGGRVESVLSPDSFVIKDRQGQNWDIQNPAVSAGSSLAVSVGEKVKIIGQEKDGKTFQAKEIRDWDSPRPRKMMRSKSDQENSGVCGQTKEDCGGNND